MGHKGSFSRSLLHRRVIQEAMRTAYFMILAAFGLLSPFVPAQERSEGAKAQPTLAERTRGMQHIGGFLSLDWDARAGKLYLEIPKPGSELLYTDSLPYGTGSNDLGLDRGQTAPARVVRFERQGPKVLLIESNERFRTSAIDPAEILATRQSFPESVLWGFKLDAEAPNGALLVDATEFFLRDVHGVGEALTRTQQGSYKLDATRSAIAMDNTKGFPLNTEVEAMLTFTTDAAPRGEYVRDVTPDPHALTIRERQSFIALPESGFVPRRYDPRAGYFDLQYRDYAASLGEDLNQRFIERHRLIKKDPNCKSGCDPVQPLIYYVDRGAPEPIRSALVEGASWWNQAFTAAGWHNAFQVKVLPEGADPMDLRYNIIQWVHRYSRGWSYGATITDPRTGEILKGNVTLGSLRGRQDYLIAEALLSPYTGPHAKGFAANDPHDPMLQMVLARIRQLSAHETGHTLGLAHNFAASSVGHGTSVMDYPHPLVELRDGVPDLSHAYASNIGVWDKVAIDYGYRQFAPGISSDRETAALNGILITAQSNGLPYITDQDARPLGSLHPHAHLWDNGADSADELNRVLAVRAAALERFGPAAIREGVPMAALEETLVPLYLFHRYQTEAAAKLIGGLQYEYNLRGDGQPNPVIVARAEQQKTLDAVLKTLTPEVLTPSDSLLAILPPHPPGFGRTQESLPSQVGLAFDPIAAAEASADLTLALLCDPERASRLVDYQARDPKSMSLRSVLEDVSKTTAERPQGVDALSSEVGRAVEFRGLEAMLRLANDKSASSQARAVALAHLDDLLHEWTTEVPPAHTAEAVHRRAMIDRVQAFKDHPERFEPAKPIQAPPGMPIGEDGEN